MTERLSQICRLCLGQCDFKFSLFAGSIIHQIESLTSIKIVENDRLPKSCCESCITNIYLSYKFQQCIIESDKKLQEELIQNEIDIIEETKLLPQLFEITYLEDNMNDDSNKLRFVEFEDGNDNVWNESYKNDDNNVKFSNNTAIIDKIFTKLKCSECKLEFESKKKFNRHMMKHNIKKCPFCSVMMRKDNLKRHIEIHSDCPGICDICGKKVKNKESLRGHINYQHKNNTTIKCEYCDKQFKSKAQYNTHRRKVHLGIKNYQCDMCGKHFFGKYELTKHLNLTHMGGRPYICQYCKKAFSTLYARKVHIRQHTKETPYMCEICAAGFRQKVSLNTHLRSKHPIVIENNDGFEEISNDLAC